MAATSDTACPLHQGSSANVTMTLGGLRSDAGTFSIAPMSMVSLPGRGPAQVASIDTLRAHPRHRPPSLTPLVLRL